MTEPTTQPERLNLKKWTVACALAQVAGIIVAGLLAAGVPGFPEWVGTILIFVLWLGVGLGLVQGLFIKHHEARLPSGTWLLASVGGASAIAAVTLSAPLWRDGVVSVWGPLGQAEAPEAIVIAFVVALVVGLGALHGTAQWLVLRRFFPRAWLWIPATAVAYSSWMSAAFLSLLAGVALVVVCLAFLPGLALHLMLDPARTPPPAATDPAGTGPRDGAGTA